MRLVLVILVSPKAYHVMCRYVKCVAFPDLKFLTVSLLEFVISWMHIGNVSQAKVQHGLQESIGCHLSQF